MLDVESGCISDKPANGCKLRRQWEVTGMECWYVRVVGSDGTAAIPMEFARKRDAEIAMAAIADLDTWEGRLSEISARLNKFTIEDIQRKMVENLAW